MFPASCPWGFLAVSRSSGRVLYANEHIHRYYVQGVMDNEAITDLFDFPVRTSFNKLVSGQETVNWVGRVTPLSNPGGVTSLEILLVSDPEDGDCIWLHTLEHPSIGGVQRFSSRSELRMLQLLLENTLEYVFICDAEQRIIIANNAFQKAVSNAHGGLTGLPINRFVGAHSAAWLKEINQQVRQSGKPSINKVANFEFAGGKQFWLQMSTVPVFNDADKTFIGTVSVASDIGELKKTESDLRKAIEDAEAASRAKGEFLAAISHEIRTPINGIIGASDLCLDSDLNEEQSAYMHTVVQCSETLLTLVNDVLDFSKIEAGQMKLEIVRFNLCDLLDSVAEEFSPAINHKGLECRVTYPDDFPCSLMGDPTRIKQILYNLVGNAVKFTTKGSIFINLKVLEEKREFIRFVVSVKDTGIGISKRGLDSIFLSFTQADMSTTRKFGGTGLGLAICKQLTALMEGDLRVRSDLGKGSSFSLELCLDLAEATSAYSESSKGADLLASLPEAKQQLSILLVEDNPVNQQVALLRIQKLGHHVEVVDNGQIGVETWRQGDFDCILMDIQMPIMDGHAAVREIRRLEAEGNMEPIFIVAMTAHAFIADREQCFSEGMNEYISKPFRAEDLKRVFSTVQKSLSKAKGSVVSPVHEMISVLDPSELEDFREIAEIFVETSVIDLEILGRAIKERDYDRIKFKTHRLKGSLSVFHQEESIRVADALEAACLEKDESEMIRLSDLFTQGVHSFREALLREFL